MNPYHRLFDPQHDAAEHASELAIGMAIPYCSPTPERSISWEREMVVRQLRDVRRRPTDG
jgi:hypothetical protein